MPTLSSWIENLRSMVFICCLSWCWTKGERWGWHPPKRHLLLSSGRRHLLALLSTLWSTMTKAFYVLCHHWFLLNSLLWWNCGFACFRTLFGCLHVRWGCTADRRRSTVGGGPGLCKNRLSICGSKVLVTMLKQLLALWAQSVWIGSLVQTYRTQSSFFLFIWQGLVAGWVVVCPSQSGCWLKRILPCEHRFTGFHYSFRLSQVNHNSIEDRMHRRRSCFCVYLVYAFQLSSSELTWHVHKTKLPWSETPARHKLSIK